jgi:signal peptidase II
MLKNKKYFIVFVAIIFLDLLTKSIALSSIETYANPGIFLGQYANSPALFRVVSLSTIAGFLIAIYFLMIYLLPKGLYKVKYSITLLIAGVSANVFDRVYRGITIDFIPFNLFNNQYYFNLADVSLVLGAFYCTYLLFFDDKSIWFEQNERKRFLVNPKEQYRLALKFVFFAFISCFIIGIFSITYIQSYLLNISRDSLYFYVLIYLILVFVICLYVFLVGLFISHRSAGPLYAFEQYIEKLLEGDNSPFELRDGDNYKHLVKVANKLRNHLNKS